MANTVVSLVSIALLCLTTAQGSTNFHGISSSVTDHDFHIDGICETAVETKGYQCEEHKVHIAIYILSFCYWIHFPEIMKSLFHCWSQVETDDGYILSLQRLPAGRSGHKADKPPVLLQHGLFCVSYQGLDRYIYKFLRSF